MIPLVRRWRSSKQTLVLGLTGVLTIGITGEADARQNDEAAARV